TYLSARVTLGRALIELGQLDDARAELETVLKSATENLAAIRGIAEISHKQGSLQQALRVYKAALSIARNDPELAQTVSELSRQVPPHVGAAADDARSREDMRKELKAVAQPRAAAATAPIEMPAPVRSPAPFVPPTPVAPPASFETPRPVESEAPTQS